MNYGGLTPPVRQAARWPVFLVVAAAALFVGLVLGMRLDDISTPATDELDYAGLNEVYRTVLDNYDGEIDKAALIEGAKRGLVAGLGDDYTVYFSAAEADEFQDSLEGSFEGIGAELANRDGKLTIASVIDGAPAQKAGLKTGDIIGRVDETDTLDWQPDPAVKIIRGERGTSVHLTIIRDGEIKQFDIVRDKVTDPSVKYEIIDGVGYMRISRFADGTTAQLAKEAAKKFQDAAVKGVVLDLRGNSGGYVDAANEVAGLWVKRGDLVVTEKTGDRVVDESRASGNNILGGLPTVVLIDGGSASASEILAGALRDDVGAKLAGTKSFGKGSVQIMKELTGGAQLKITIAKWFTPAGKNIDKSGIEPDEVIEFDDEQYQQGVDNQKQAALELLK
jgi:carboxyl-terminal processing protease